MSEIPFSLVLFAECLIIFVLGLIAGLLATRKR